MRAGGSAGAVRTGVVLLLASCLTAASCSRAAAPEPPEAYPASFADGAILHMAGGDLVPLDPGEAARGPGLPAGVAPSVAAAAVLDGRSAALALNRSGLVRIAVDPGRRRYRVESLGTGEEFAGRSVGGLFLRDGILYCLLYRDPFFETQPPRDPPSVLLAVDPEQPASGVRPVDLGLGPEGGGLFALFPTSDGSWAIQLRREVREGFESSFRSYDPVSGSSRAISRADFEGILAPRLLSRAPESLRGAALALAPAGVPALATVSMEDGSREAFTFGDGSPEDAVELRGAVTGDGAVLVAWNAVAATARDGTVSAFRLPVPLPGAVYRDAVLLDGTLLAVWEVGVFPNVEESGVVLLPAP